MFRVFLLLLIIFTANVAYGFGTGMEGCSGDCTACHTATTAEVVDLLAKLDTGIVLEKIGPAPIKGLYELTVKRNKQVGIIYLDFSKKFLIQGNIIDVAGKQDLTGRKLDDLKYVNPADIPLEHALVLGNKNGSRKLYVFSDPECPFCLKLHGELLELIKEDRQLCVYILLNPLKIHPDSAWKTDAILCTAKSSMPQALRMLEDSYNKKPVEKTACGKNYAADMAKIAENLGVGATPSIVLPNGKLLVGAKKKEELKKLLDEGGIKKK